MGTQRAAARLGCKCQVKTPLTLLDEKPQFLYGEYKSQESFFSLTSLACFAAVDICCRRVEKSLKQ